jgi:hypothetical protein
MALGWPKRANKNGKKKNTDRHTVQNEYTVYLSMSEKTSEKPENWRHSPDVS